MIHKKCQICQRYYYKINEKINGYQIQVINHLCKNIRGQNEIQGLIKSFLFDDDEHMLVLSERKKRNPNQGRIISGSESESDDYFIYTTIETNMCKPCFLYHVCQYYDENNRLPFLRRDIFIFECNNDDDAVSIDDFFMKNKNKYILQTFTR